MHLPFTLPLIGFLLGLAAGMLTSALVERCTGVRLVLWFAASARWVGTLCWISLMATALVLAQVMRLPARLARLSRFRRTSS